PLRLVANGSVGRNYLLFYRDNASTVKGYVGYGGTADNGFQVWNQETGVPVLFGNGNVEAFRIGNDGQLQITGTYSGSGLRQTAGLELGIGGSGTVGVILTYNRSSATYLPLQINGSYLDIQGPTPNSTQVRLGNLRAFSNEDNSFLRLNPNSDFPSGVYSPGQIRTSTWLVAEDGLKNSAGGRVVNLSGLGGYGSVWVQGTTGGFHGIGVNDGSLNPVFMSEG